MGILAHWRIHNSFHISLLKPFKGTPPITPIDTNPPFLEDDTEILVPKSILDHDKTTTCTGIKYLCYLVKYQNHSIEESQWIQKSSLTPEYNHLITTYH